MRIIGKQQKDYYDGVANQFIDRDLTYLRNCEEIELTHHTPVPCAARRTDINSNLLEGEYGLIGFCGKYYPLFFTKEMLQRSPTSSPYFVNKCYYSFESIPVKKKAQSKRYSRFSFFGSFESRTKDFFNSDFSNLDYLFNKAPIFFIGQKTYCYPIKFKVVLNPLLKDYGFASIVEPYAAFQELYMFLSNQARPMKPIPTISDEMKILTHGFNKESFRKPKSTKK